MEKVSIITVCLNAAKHIENALKSVVDQTYPEIEHVVIDGGSTDGTLEVIRRYRTDLGYFLSEPDRGIYHAMNKGVRAATGDILFFLNADDRFVDNQVVADVCSVFSHHPQIQIIYGNLIWELSGNCARHVQPPQVTRKYLAQRSILHQTVFARKRAFVITGNYSEYYRIVSDYEWMVKAFLRDRHEYLYYDRDVAIMGTSGLSWTTTWETERIYVMMKYFSPYEILKYRIWPKQRTAVEKRTKKLMLKTSGLIREIASYFSF